MIRKVIGYYSILLGVSVIGLWVMLLINQEQPEGNIELAFHLFSEFLMAMLCLTGGYLLLKKKVIGKTLNLFGFGLVIYSVLNAAGYYGQRNEYIMLIMFVVLFILTSVFTLMLFRLNDIKNSR